MAQGQLPVAQGIGYMPQKLFPSGRGTDIPEGTGYVAQGLKDILCKTYYLGAQGTEHVAQRLLPGAYGTKYKAYCPLCNTKMFLMKTDHLFTTV